MAAALADALPSVEIAIFGSRFRGGKLTGHQRRLCSTGQLARASVAPAKNKKRIGGPGQGGGTPPVSNPQFKRTVPKRAGRLTARCAGNINSGSKSSHPSTFSPLGWAGTTDRMK